MDANLKLEPTDLAFSASKESQHWYSKAIGTLMYLMLGTRLDVAFAVAYLSRSIANPTPACGTALKRVSRYLQGTRSLLLVYQGDPRPLVGYTDADWGGDPLT